MSSPESIVVRQSTGNEKLLISNSPQQSEAIDLCSPGGKDIENGNADNDNEVTLEILDDGLDDDSDDAGVSEGEDEVHCTQLPNDSDGGGDEKEEEANSTATFHPVHDQQEESKVANDNVRNEINENCTELHEQTTIRASFQSSEKDICFICGADLTKIKRRVDHIKRCSKKHGITGRDVKINNDHEEFIDMNHLEQNDAAKPTNNPYSKFREKDWHGNANKVLQEEANNGGAWSSAATSAQSATTSISQNQGATRQMSLASFVTIPMRNLNNVLMGGARRISKVDEIVNQRADTRKASGTPSNSRKRGRFGNSNYSSTRSCPLYKRITGTDFVCDGFQYAKSAKTNNHFLTHFHADHYGGITSGWSAGIIYCSVPTATLVSQQLGVDKKFIHPLPMLTPTVIQSRNKPITVTLLDANHCPGAVMFLFEVGKKKILHVGDFRWNQEIMMQQAPLRALQREALDELFLDTTYCDPKYCLPTQEEAIQATIKVFDAETKSNGKTLHLFGSYTIGKERIYMKVASRFGMKVYVDARRYKILSALQWSREQMKLLTTRKEEASIWVVPLGDINFKKMSDYIPLANCKPFSFPYKRVVGYRPTGWSMGGKPSSSIISTRQKDNMTVHSVPYSEHSSFPELLNCLECLKPQRIVPTVSVSKSDEQVQLLLSHLRQKQTKLKL
ncbi:MAG: hypothetical protein SGBAC_008637 [Bacillariaceae sp.]